MLFCLIGTDKPDALAIRLANREAHVKYWKESGRIAAGGPFTSDDGAAMNGSLLAIEAADRARAQSAWILQGALDWARLILQEDAKQNRNKAMDHLGEPWAVPLAEARLSTFLAADKSTASDDDGPEAFLSGSIEDAQSRYNLRALLGGPKVPELEQRVLECLCSQVNAPPGTAAVIIAGLREASPASETGTGSAGTSNSGDERPYSAR